jgi:hypothetical protein
VTTSPTKTFVTRAELGDVVGPAGSMEGTLLCAPEGDVVVGLTPAAAAEAARLTSETLKAAGIGPADRVLAGVNNDGDGAGPVLAQAVAGLARAVALVGPRGRMRLLRAIRAMRPTTLVATPCGASDLLARLHLEFLVDPQELGLRRLLLVGELVDDRTYRHLEAEFDVEVVETWCDPLFGVALAHRRPTAEPAFTPVRPDVVDLASLADDDWAEPGAGGPVEWAVRPLWLDPDADLVVRSGWVSGGPAADGAAGDVLPAPAHTVGEHVLVRGRWLSLAAIDRALSLIDGVSGWTLELSRPGTLDQAELHIVLGRPTLLDNPMWAGRIEDAVVGLTPISIAIHLHGPDDYVPAGRVRDHRGHHLGEDRRAVKAAAGQP